MKIFSATALTLASLVSVALAGRDFDPKEHGGDKNKTSFKTHAKFGDGGAQIDLSPAGNSSSGQLITLKMSRLKEVDASNTTVQEAKNFQSMNASWTDFEPLTINGSDAYASYFLTTFKVQDTANKNATEDTTFNLTATIYTGNGTAMNGNQTINVPAGALKFSVSILNWPFASTTNSLQFVVELVTRGKKGGKGGAPKKGPKPGNHPHLDRVDMGEGMFMDAPTLADIDDGTIEAVQSSINTSNNKVELVWVFPSFSKSLYYDPVLGSEDTSSADTTGSTDGSVPTPAPTPTPTPSTTKSGGASILVSVLAAGLVAAATAFVM